MRIVKSERDAKLDDKTTSGNLRRRSIEQTKLAILDAAREMFSEDSYDHVKIRDIAEKSGCNSSLIARYFGSKEGLFREAIVSPIESTEPGFDLASRFIDFAPDWIAGKYSHGAFDPSRAIFRSASIPPAKEMLRAAIEDNFIDPISEIIVSTENQLRAEVLAAVLYGLNAFRNVIGTTELSSVTAKHLGAVIQPLLRELMTPQQARHSDE